jgi:ATP-dependent Zn protease
LEVDNVTCYFRHNQMKEVFAKAGVEVTKENRKEIDRIIHSIVGVEYKNCSATWKMVKERLSEDEHAFVEKLKSAL